MFPFTPHTTLRLDYGSGGSSLGSRRNSPTAHRACNSPRLQLNSLATHRAAIHLKAYRMVAESIARNGNISDYVELCRKCIRLCQVGGRDPSFSLW
ncbi:MAG: hypothetical protein MUF72_15365 [Elainella sp. Prado103]|jgi:hypothetical protein|nr:hypothetical protein [Elainella sp. Prado103]